MAKTTPATPTNGNDAPRSFEADLWASADKLRNNLDASEYKHVLLGLIFLKYISDAFEEKHAALEAEKASGADAEDPDEYLLTSFWPAAAEHGRTAAPWQTILQPPRTE